MIKNIDTIFNKLEASVTFIPIINKLSKKNETAFKILIATMMSARTKDEVTEVAAERLFKLGKTPKEMLKLKQKEIESLIYPVGFYKTKAKNIIDISKTIISKFNGKVPETIEELTKLPGVGLKTAALVVAEGFGMDEICVDTHVHRISNRLGLVKTKKPEETYMELKKVLPKKYWRKINFFMVSFGKTICKPISPTCPKCKLNKICPYAKIQSK